MKFEMLVHYYTHLHSTEPLMRSIVQLLVFLLWSLVEVHSQTAPYISFMGETLPNHAYVNLSLVGNDESGNDSVQCHTDLTTCCTGQDSGDWYLPGMSLIPPYDELIDVYAVHRVKQVDLRRRRSNAISGIYRCDIAVQSEDQSTIESVYVGLYSRGGIYMCRHTHTQFPHIIHRCVSEHFRHAQ